MSSSKVKSIQASRCTTTGQVIHTLMCEYPRAIHAQLLTHRVFSKNSSSSRAVPISKAIAQIKSNPAKPIFTENEKGMQGKPITDSGHLAIVNAAHNLMQNVSCDMAALMSQLEVHKQNAGRYLEPYQNIRIVLTSTEWENWDWLRLDAAAQPEIRELAEAIYDARKNADIMDIAYGEWHVPFIERNRNVAGELMYYTKTMCEQLGKPHFKGVSLDSAIMVSMSACAQTSYRNLDLSLEKAEDLCGKLFNGNKVHASPSEHQATPMPPKFQVATTTNSLKDIFTFLPEGVTHMSRDGDFWSGNFRNLIQNRQLLPNHDGALINKDNQEDQSDGTGIN